MNLRETLRLLIACALLFGQPLLAHAARPSSAWAGTWRLNIPHSRFSGPAPRGETRTIEVSGRRMTVRACVLDSAGKTIRFHYSVTLDGRFSPLVGNPDGDSIAVRLVNPRRTVIEVRRGAKISATAVTGVSSKRLVMERSRLLRAGSPSRDRLVYDRVR